jgi:predicted transcriptional regulator
MTKKKLILILSIIIAVAHSCKDQNKENSQMKDVMAIHDEVMPKMGTIGQLVSELDQKITNDTSSNDYVTAKEDLKAAHKAMMDWMKNFGDRFDGDEILKGKALTEEKQKWLDEEETKVKALKEQINSSIEQAQDLLKNN